MAADKGDPGDFRSASRSSSYSSLVQSESLAQFAPASSPRHASGAGSVFQYHVEPMDHRTPFPTTGSRRQRMQTRLPRRGGGQYRALCRLPPRSTRRLPVLPLGGAGSARPPYIYLVQSLHPHIGGPDGGSHIDLRYIPRDQPLQTQQYVTKARNYLRLLGPVGKGRGSWPPKKC